MDRRRLKQNAVIILGVVIVLLLLWRLRSGHPVGVGGWIGTNIFGPATLNVFTNSESGGGTSPNAPTTTNILAPSGPNLPIQPTTNPPDNAPPPHPRPTLSTNLLNTNGPVTIIDVPDADLQTPPGVTVASNSPEAVSIQDRLGAASAAGGEIQISLSWNNMNDLVFTASIRVERKFGLITGGPATPAASWTFDRNANFPFTRTPVENIYWPVSNAPAGRYKVFVVYYAVHDTMVPSEFTVRTVVRDWKTYFFRSMINTQGQVKPVCTLQYDPHNPDPEKRYRFVQ